MSFVNGVGNVDKATMEALAKKMPADTKGTPTGGTYTFEDSDDDVAVEVKFKSKNDLENEGKTYHWIAAKDGPDKGSHYYNSNDYDAFGNYKHK